MGFSFRYVISELFTLWAIAGFVVNFFFALAVSADARELRRPALGISPRVWFFAVLFSSVVGVIAYWIMNHSALVKDED